MIDLELLERVATENPSILVCQKALKLTDAEWSNALEIDAVHECYVRSYRAFVAEMHRRLDAGMHVSISRFADLTTKDRRLLLEKASETRRNRAADRALEQEKRHATKPGYGRIKESRR
jgi:hypothetical protein